MSPPLLNASRSLPLNGEWLLRSDHGNVGLAEGWHKSPDEFLSPAQCHAVTVPGAWQHVLGEHYHYLGWYLKRVTLPDDWSHPRTRIRFESVATAIDVWANGHHLGRHEGDWIPIEFDLSTHAGPGRTIDVVARVDEMLGHITKGFHDMLSIHHGGIWGDVSIIGSGACFARPNGVSVRADARTGRVSVTAELADGAADGRLVAEIRNPRGEVVARFASGEHATRSVAPSDGGVLPPRRIEATTIIGPVEHWSPDTPSLYTATVSLEDESGAADTHIIRFGFRTVEVRGTRVLLNDTPLHIRGILHWGHEPKHLAPAPTPQQVRDEFIHLKKLGFNAVCLCMWYPPRHFYEIADETGMLLWQEHPNWHAPMTDDNVAEYQRLYGEFLRRDRNHPSIVLVSATCEHPTFHPDVASWWWRTARAMLPDTLLQVQTASFAWSDPDQTDLYDEHTYDNNNRWVTYLRDLQEKLAELPAKPFIMGETVLFHSWPDFEAIHAAVDQSLRWSLPSMAESGMDFEQQVIERWGRDTLERFRRQADRHHLLGRKFQIELFRRYPNHAGLVTNHLIDVPPCSCGFLDAVGRWRFTPQQTRGWLCDAPLLLATPDERRSFTSGERVNVRVLIANFSIRDVATTVEVILVARMDQRDHGLVGCCDASEVSPAPTSVNPAPTPVGHAFTPVGSAPTPVNPAPTQVGRALTPVGSALTPVGPAPTQVSRGREGAVDQPLPHGRGSLGENDSMRANTNVGRLTARRGEVGAVMVMLTMPIVDRPTRVTLVASTPDGRRNDWDLWVFPPPPPLPSATYRLDGLPFEPRDAEPDPLEKGYSRGFGLPVKTWINRLPDSAVLVPDALPWRPDESIPTDARMIVTHRLTPALLHFLERGGRVLLLASKAPGGLGTEYQWLFGQCPLVIDSEPSGIGVSGADISGTGVSGIGASGAGVSPAILSKPSPERKGLGEGSSSPLQPGDSDWIIDLLGMDLTRTYARVIPVGKLGLLKHVDPIVRLVYTHDAKELTYFDMLFATRVGAGVLAVSSLDHHDPAGRWLLHQVVEGLASNTGAPHAITPIETLRSHAVNG